MKITVCIGSSCHVKGARLVVERLQQLVAEHQLGGRVTIGGTFCMGNCAEGVCVTADDKMYSVTPETTDSFFSDEVLSQL